MYPMTGEMKVTESETDKKRRWKWDKKEVKGSGLHEAQKSKGQGRAMQVRVRGKRVQHRDETGQHRWQENKDGQREGRRRREEWMNS